MDARAATAFLGAGSGGQQVMRKAISVLLLVATLLGLYNVYADSPEVQRLDRKSVV